MKHKIKHLPVIIPALCVCAIALFVVYCGKDSNPNPIEPQHPTYSLTVNIDPTDGGTTTRVPSQTVYESGTPVTVTAVANDGYEFTGWSGASTTANPQISVTMDANKEITASFRAVDIIKSSEKQITAFFFTAQSVLGQIDEEAKTISVEVPIGTIVTDLVPTIFVSDAATVSPLSGMMQDFTSPVTYTVTAEDGSTMQYTVTVTVAQQPLTVPNTPTDVSATAISSSSITITWNAVPDEATGYYIYRSTSSSDNYTQVGTSTTSTSFTDTELSSGTTYYYRVAAYNSAGTGTQSSTASATTQITITVPNAPTDVSAEAASSSSITVTWNAVSGATEYRVYRSTSSTGTYTLVGTSTTTTSFTNTGLSASTTYYYRVRAYNSVGESDNSSTVSAMTVFDPFNPNITYGTLTDSRDGKTYRTVTIGTQTWMAENLNYNASGSWCYGNSPDGCAKYGRLYDWATAMGLISPYNSLYWVGSDVNRRGVCPADWHLPSNAEWDVLVTAVGFFWTAGWTLKSMSGWNDGGNGTDDYGFSALPGGRRWWDGTFEEVGNFGFWWSATADYEAAARSRSMQYGDGHMTSGSGSKVGGFSVRCLRD